MFLNLEETLEYSDNAGFYPFLTLYLSLVQETKECQNEIELLEDDMSVDFITGNEICLDDIVREQIYLSLPMKCLCREDCLGLCTLCGTNLNIGKCNCEDKKGHPGFSKLKNIKLDG